FAPLAAGARAATITLTDDAVNSPQVINLGGFANAALTLGAAPSGSTSATISAGQTAQFNLQITPAAGYSGTISLVYSGAPAAAAIQGPATVQISSGSPAPFTVMVTTTGATSGIVPFSYAPRATPFPVFRSAPLLIFGIILLLLLAVAARRDSSPHPRRVAFAGVPTAILAILMLSATGCGGGSISSNSTTTPPPQNN